MSSTERLLFFLASIRLYNQCAVLNISGEAALSNRCPQLLLLQFFYNIGGNFSVKDFSSSSHLYYS